MFWFFKNGHFRPDEERRRAALARGFLFASDELEGILAIWRDLITGQPIHTAETLSVTLKDGGKLEILPDCLSFEAPALSHEAMRATMLHAQKHWGGKARYGLDENADRESRLLLRAYAEVYGVEWTDDNDNFLPTALTKADLDRLPDLRREIRAKFSDAPPERPDEAAQLAAAYARRFPFSYPQAA